MTLPKTASGNLPTIDRGRFRPCDAKADVEASLGSSSCGARSICSSNRCSRSDDVARRSPPRGDSVTVTQSAWVRQINACNGRKAHCRQYGAADLEPAAKQVSGHPGKADSVTMSDQNYSFV